MELNRLNLVFPILAVALILSLFGCGGADSNPTSIPVTPQSLPTTVAPTPILTPTRTPTPTITPPGPSEGLFGIEWGTEGTGDGQFDDPRGVAVASDGSVYVVDFHDHQIRKFTSEGVFVSKWGSYGTGDGELYEPSRIAVAFDGSVYVSDVQNHRIQKFSPVP